MKPSDRDPHEAATLPRAPKAQGPGSVAGYTLLQRLGRGGMGEVWLAEQSQPVRRKVALKLVRGGIDDEEARLRFEAERQALALMAHPNIAAVLDAGVTEKGQPYFVMEHVPGRHVTSHCDERNLGVRDRLDLFLQACAGVEHAHQKGIIHRDIKPSNVLVAEAAGGPSLKIIDFGVAKALGRRLTDETLQTVEGVMIGTPEYMSPEQAAGRLDVDTRADVYGLGVLLYELLTGAVPFLRDGEARPSLVELHRRILTHDPLRPSARVTSAGTGSGAAAARRCSDPPALRRQLRGDLDWIVMKALERDRERRYASVAELAADVRRHLADEPVSAGPPSLGYRLRKYVRRHRIAVLAAAGVLAAVALGLGGTVHGLWAARDEAMTAEEVTVFMTGLFEVVDPRHARTADWGEVVTAREVLDRGSVRITRELSGRPEIQARLQEAMARAYLGLGLYEDARSLVDRVVATRRTVLGPRHRDTLRARSLLFETLVRGADYEAAERLGPATHAAQRALLGDGHADTLATARVLADLRLAQERVDEADGLYRRILEARERELGPGHPDTCRARTALAFLLYRQKRLDEGERLARRSLELQRAALGEANADTLRSLTVLAAIILDQGRNAEALALNEQGLAIERRVLGDRHPATLSRLNLLAASHDRTWQVAWKAGHPETAADHLAAAERHYREALEGLAATLGEDHPSALTTEQNYASLIRNSGRPGEALALFERNLRGQEATHGPDHSSTVIAASLVGLIHWEFFHDAAAAEPHYRRRLEWLRRNEPPSSAALRGHLLQVARIVRELGRVEESDTLADEHLRLCEEHVGQGDLSLARASVHALRGDAEGALRELERALEAGMPAATLHGGSEFAELFEGSPRYEALMERWRGLDPTPP